MHPILSSTLRYICHGAFLHRRPKKIHSQKVLLIGNGPSLNLDFVRESDLPKFVCNHFFSSPDARKLNDTKLHHFASDPRLFALSNQSYFDFLNEVKSLTCYVPTRYYNFAKTKIRHHVYPIFYPSELGRLFNRNSIVLEPKYGYPSFDSVMFDMMMPFALYCGVKHIEMTGVDFDYSGQKHFYCERVIESGSRDNEYLNSTWKSNITYAENLFSSYAENNNIVIEKK